MEKRDITKEFIQRAVNIPEVNDLLSKVNVVAQDRFVVVRLLGNKTLTKFESKREQVINVISDIVPDPEVMFSLVEESSPRAKIFKRERRSYTFNNFIVSNTNRAAFNAIRDVSEEPTGQPVVIFGPPSVGKTHLLKALHYKIKSGGEYDIILLDAGKIVNDLFFHMKKNTLDNYVFDLFDHNYVLIDDLQKMGQQTSGKGLERIDWFLFDIYEAFFEKDGKQLVFTCDRSPMALPFSDRVRSRLFSGAAYQIEPPDEKLKRVYIERVLLKYEPLTIPDSIKEAIIKNSVNFRQIEELVQSAVEKYSNTGDEEYVINQVSVVAKTMEKGKFDLTPNDIIDSVCKLVGVEKRDILGKKRVKGERNIQTLSIIAYILVKKLKFTQVQVAHMLNKKSPLSIRKYLKKVEALRIDNMDFRIQMDGILNTIFRDKKSA